MGEDSAGDNNTNKENSTAGAASAICAAGIASAAPDAISITGACEAGGAGAGNTQDASGASGDNIGAKVYYL